MQKTMEYSSASPTEKVPGSQCVSDTCLKSQGFGRFKTTSIEHDFVSQRPPHSSKRLYIWLLFFSALLSFALSMFALARYQGYTNKEFLSLKLNDSDTYDAGAPFAPAHAQRSWGAYSPYYSVQEYQPPPENCRLTQVNTVRLVSHPKPYSNMVVDPTTWCTLPYLWPIRTHSPSSGEVTSCGTLYQR